MAWYNTVGKDADTVISSRVRLARNINGYPFASKLDASGANELIEKIVVHEKVVAADGSKSQQVDIYYKFIGCINRKRSPASYATPEKTALQEHLSSCSQTA